MAPQEIYDDLKAKFGDAVIEAKLDVLQPWIRVAENRTKEICSYLRTDGRMQFDCLSCLSGVETNDGKLAVVYHLASMVRRHKIVLKAVCTKESPHIQSIADVWGTANWHEREAFDLIGIIFDGHPDLRRILLPYDWEGHPLRKDYKVPEFYDGMKVPY
jgi:NADH-quinone oxidoreductase subunit C